MVQSVQQEMENLGKISNVLSVHMKYVSVEDIFHYRPHQNSTEEAP